MNKRMLAALLLLALLSLAAKTVINLATQVAGLLPTANGGTAVNSTASFPSSGTVATTATVPAAGPCTNQAVTALNNGAAPTCTTITSAYTSGTFSAAAHNLLSATHGDSTAASGIRGDMLAAVGATPTWQRVAHSSASGGYWKWNGTDVVASTLAAARTGSCTNQVVTVANADAAPTCASVSNAMLAAAAYAKTRYQASCTGVFTASTTIYMPGYGGAVTACTGATASGGMPAHAGTLKNLYVISSAAGKSGDAITIYVAGTTSGITCAIGTGTSCNDVTHTYAVTAGQSITVRVSTGATETLANLNLSFELWN